MRMNRGTWCGWMIAALVCTAGGAVAKPDKQQPGDASARMSAGKADGKTSMKVVKESKEGSGATKSVERSVTKTDDGVVSTKQTSLTTPAGVQVVRNDTKERSRTEDGTTTVKRTGTTVVTGTEGVSRKSQRSSTSMREGSKVTRVSTVVSPGGKVRSAGTTVVKEDDALRSSTTVTRRSGATVTRESVREPARSGSAPAPTPSSGQPASTDD